MPFTDRRTQHCRFCTPGPARGRRGLAARTVPWPRTWLLAVALAWLLPGLLSAAAADERRYYIDARSGDQGLVQHTINAFFQDRAGYMWIATQGGLNAYDGYRYRLFQHDADDTASLCRTVSPRCTAVWSAASSASSTGPGSR